MPFDAGGGHRYGPTHVNVRTPNRTPGAAAQRHAARISTVRQIATSPTLSAKQRIASAPKKERARLTDTMHRVLNAYASSRGVTGVTPDVAQFSKSLSRATGGIISPTTAAAWAKEEGGNGGANANFLNIGTGFNASINSQFTNPKRAGKLTAKFLKGEAFGASPAIRSILTNARGKDTPGQLQAIAASGWATDPAYAQKLQSVAGTVGEKPGKKPSRKDLQTLVKSGINPKRRVESTAKSPAVQHRQTKSAAQVLGPALTKWLKPASSDVDVKHLNPVFARHLVAVAKESGQPITVTSGYRSMARQAAIDPGTNPKAPPGYSDHQFGMAADISVTDRQRALMAKHGLETGQAGPGVTDPPHTELTKANAIRKAQKFGPVRAAYAPSDVPMAVGDLTHSKVEGFGSGAAFVGSSGSGAAISSYASATGQSASSVRQQLKSGRLTARQLLSRLGGIYGSLTTTGSTSSTPSSGTSSLTRRYGKPAV